MTTTINFLNSTIERANAYCEYFSIPCRMIEKRINRAIKNNDEKALLYILFDFAGQHHSCLDIYGKEELYNDAAKAAYQEKVNALAAIQAEALDFCNANGIGC